FLNQISRDVLPKIMFPLGHLQKAEVREIAKEHNLATANKKDSTGICFIGERNFKEFLSEYLPAQPGKMQTLMGETKGQHDGLMYYTIGQRHGLGIGGAGEPWFAVGKNVADNMLYVEQGDDNHFLYSDRLIASDLTCLTHVPQSTECTAEFRYHEKDSKANVTILAHGTPHVDSKEIERDVTAGQAIVLNQHKVCFGGGTSEEIIKKEQKLLHVG